jgi:hypothetical protein
MYHVIHRTGDASLRRFAQQMFATGVFTTGVCSLGQSPLMDALHSIGAGAYMIDHIVLFRVLNVPTVYKRVFFTSFFLMAAAMLFARRIFDWNESNDGTHRPGVHRLLFLLELCIMVCENALFYSFVWGMDRGLVPLRPDDTSGGSAAVHSTGTTMAAPSALSVQDAVAPITLPSVVGQLPSSSSNYASPQTDFSIDIASQ